MPLSMSLSVGSTLFNILPHMCKEQKDAMQELLSAADDIGAAASMHSGQGYTALHEARTKFQTLLTSLMDKSRICILENHAQK